MKHGAVAFHVKLPRCFAALPHQTFIGTPAHTCPADRCLSSWSVTFAVMEEYYPPVGSVSLPLYQCGHADEVTCQADDVRSQGGKRTLRLRATTSGNAPQADVGHEIDGPGFPYSALLPAKKPTLRPGTDSHSVTKSEFWRFAIRAQGCCAHASTDVHLSGGMGWEVRSRGRSRWHDSSLRGWISQTGVG
jgi:hypothetical protein